MTNEPTICAHCRHYFTTRDGQIWYDQYCRAAPTPESGKINPVTGTMNRTEYENARRNKGSCQEFQPNQTTKEFHQRATSRANSKFASKQATP